MTATETFFNNRIRRRRTTLVETNALSQSFFAHCLVYSYETFLITGSDVVWTRPTRYHFIHCSVYSFNVDINHNFLYLFKNNDRKTLKSEVELSISKKLIREQGEATLWNFQWDEHSLIVSPKETPYRLSQYERERIVHYVNAAGVLTPQFVLKQSNIKRLLTVLTSRKTDFA